MYLAIRLANFSFSSGSSDGLTLFLQAYIPISSHLLRGVFRRQTEGGVGAAPAAVACNHGIGRPRASRPLAPRPAAHVRAARRRKTERRREPPGWRDPKGSPVMPPGS